MHREQQPFTETKHQQLGLLEKHLLNDYQHGLPLVTRPFQVMAEKLGTTEEMVLDTLARLQQQGYVSRVGAVFRANTIGASTLATMAVPEDKLETVAKLVNSYTEVNHNYQREHHFNLWFVVTAADEYQLQNVLKDIEQQSNIAVLYLPMLEDYHIDLGFDLGFDLGIDSGSVVNLNASYKPATKPKPIVLDSLDESLVFHIQRGLPFASRPYSKIAQTLEIHEEEVVQRLQRLLEDGVIKRLGVVVRHHELGYRANAMTVWNIPDNKISELGLCMGQFEFVTLCYQRPRRLPEWPYNLFTMIHGRDRDEVLSNIQTLVTCCGLEAIEHDVLFSTRRFKQRGAIYQSGLKSPVRERQYG